MKKLSESERQLAARIARDAINADDRGNGVIVGQAISELFGVVGYWLQRKQPTVAEFRGESVPPKMLRMPHGRAVSWENRWNAVKAWSNNKE